jgi:hypothetical protein
MLQMPSMFFYTGQFQDGEFSMIKGDVARNRDLFPDPDVKRVTVKVGTFSLQKVD